MMKNYFYYFLLFVSSIACTPSEDNNTNSQFYQNYYSDNILPALTTFKQTTERQVSLINDFQKEKSIANFEKIQQQWLTCAVSYSKARVYNFVEVKKQFFDIRIYNFPANTTSIESNIKEQTTFNNAYFARKSSTTKGLAAMEYLLFDTSESLDLLHQDVHRNNYLLGIANELLQEANSLLRFWEEEYKNQFINANDKLCVNNARCIAFNQIINVLDVARVTKLEKPAGINTLSNPSVTLLEAFRSGNSLALITAQLNEIEYIYFNSTTNFASLVNDIDTDAVLSPAIKVAFENVYTEIDTLDTNLEEAIVNNPLQTVSIYNALNELIRLFSVDGASLLSVTTLPTDNDSD